ncbi:hypothetical protein [Anaplasma capra]|uniref:hypothetical protein n=1 Tax=Anaplasma capra TaxID=1562740 RepID=UPI0021D578E7|nr:hypothetical protein [Anaplasma capra]MCU7612655.1 hypothetical protein [Anaplasma capra]
MWQPKSNESARPRENTSHEADTKSSPTTTSIDTNHDKETIGKLNALHTKRSAEELPEKLPEEWQVIGSSLRKASYKFQQDRQRHLDAYGHVGRHDGHVPIISERKISAERALVEDTNALRFLRGRNMQFWGNGVRAFAMYYVRASNGGCDLHFRALSDEGVQTVRVNDHPISVQDVRNYQPAFVAFDEGGVHRVVVAMLERETPKALAAAHAKEVAVKVYSVDNSNAISIVNEKSIKLNVNGRLAGLYCQPLSVTRDDAGNIIVVSKARDRRANPSDQAYVMWRLSGKDFSIIKPRGRAGDISRHLFSRAGANPKAGTPEQLIVWGAGAGKLGLTYVGRYIQSEGQRYAMPYKAYYADIPYTKSQTAECFWGASGCHIEGQAAVLSEFGVIDFVRHIEVRGTRYVVYVDEQNKQSTLNIAAHVGDVQKVFHQVLNFDTKPISMNVRHVQDDSVGITVVDEVGVMRMYELNLAQLMLGSRESRAYKAAVNCSVLNAHEFIGIAGQGSQLVPRTNAIGTSVSTVSVVTNGRESDGGPRLEVTEFEYPVGHLQTSSNQSEATVSEATHDESTIGTEVSSSVTQDRMTGTKLGIHKEKAPAHRGTNPPSPIAASEAQNATGDSASHEHFAGSTHDATIVAGAALQSSGMGSQSATAGVSATHGTVDMVHGTVNAGTPGARERISRTSPVVTTTSGSSSRGVDPIVDQNATALRRGRIRDPADNLLAGVTGVGATNNSNPRVAGFSGGVEAGSGNDAATWATLAGGLAICALLVALVAAFVAKYRRVGRFRNEIYRIDNDENVSLCESWPRYSFITDGTSEQVYPSPVERGHTGASGV